MQTQNFVVTCRNCDGHSRIKIIDNTQVMYLDHTPIIACRLRPDMKWGFECICGNDSRMAPQERGDAGMLMAGSDKGIIERVMATLTDKPETRFKMEAA